MCADQILPNVLASQDQSFFLPKSPAAGEGPSRPPREAATAEERGAGEAEAAEPPAAQRTAKPEGRGCTPPS